MSADHNKPTSAHVHEGATSRDPGDQPVEERVAADARLAQRHGRLRTKVGIASILTVLATFVLAPTLSNVLGDWLTSIRESAGQAVDPADTFSVEVDPMGGLSWLVPEDTAVAMSDMCEDPALYAEVEAERYPPTGAALVEVVVTAHSDVSIVVDEFRVEVVDERQVSGHSVLDCTVAGLVPVWTLRYDISRPQDGTQLVPAGNYAGQPTEVYAFDLERGSSETFLLEVVGSDEARDAQSITVSSWTATIELRVDGHPVEFQITDEEQPFTLAQSA